MTSQRSHPIPDGTPLAVCLNDCEIDGGQPRSELAPICFRLGCAFAEMRWGRANQQGATGATYPQSKILVQLSRCESAPRSGPLSLS